MISKTVGAFLSEVVASGGRREKDERGGLRKSKREMLRPSFALSLKVHKIENFFDSDFGICVISLLVMSQY